MISWSPCNSWQEWEREIVVTIKLARICLYNESGGESLQTALRHT